MEGVHHAESFCKINHVDCCWNARAQYIVTLRAIVSFHVFALGIDS